MFSKFENRGITEKHVRMTSFSKEPEMIIQFHQQNYQLKSTRNTYTKFCCNYFTILRGARFIV